MLRLRPCPSQKNTSEKAAFLLLVWCDFDSLVAALWAIAFLKMQRISVTYLCLTASSTVVRSSIHTLNQAFHYTKKVTRNQQESSLIYLSLYISHYEKSENCIWYCWLLLTRTVPILLSIKEKADEIRKNIGHLALVKIPQNCQQDPKYYSSTSTSGHIKVERSVKVDAIFISFIS